jgi:hypothetical protein
MTTLSSKKDPAKANRRKLRDPSGRDLAARKLAAT